MKGKLAFLLGAAVGYVLGTRAGRERYEQIKRGALKVWNTEPVQQGVKTVRDAVDERADEVKQTIRHLGAQLLGKLSEQAARKSAPPGDADARASGPGKKKESDTAGAESVADADADGDADADEAAPKKTAAAKTGQKRAASTSRGAKGRSAGSTDKPAAKSGTTDKPAAKSGTTDKAEG